DRLSSFKIARRDIEMIVAVIAQAENKLRQGTGTLKETMTHTPHRAHVFGVAPLYDLRSPCVLADELLSVDQQAIGNVVLGDQGHPTVIPAKIPIHDNVGLNAPRQ